jgi:DNA-binding protein HU-beta
MTRLPARKHCTRCTRWLICATHFRPAARRGDCVTRLQSHCNSCVRVATRRRATVRRQRDRRQRVRVYRSLVEGDPLLPVQPFADWVWRHVMECGVTGVAAQVGVDVELVRRMAQGVYADKDGAWRPASYVRTTVVDEWMLAFGERLDDLYPYQDEDQQRKELRLSTQAQFETELAAELGIPKREAQQVLETMTDLIFKHLKADGAVVVRGLGRFKINNRPARMGRNPQTGEQIKIKASKKLKVLPNKALKDRLKVK